MNSIIRQFYLYVVAIAFIVVAAVWSQVAVDQLGVFFYGSAVIVFSVVITFYGRSILKLGDEGETDHTTDRIPHRRLVIVLWRLFGGLFATFESIIVVRHLVYGAPPYIILGSLGILIWVVSPLLFTSLHLYALSQTHYPIWLKIRINKFSYRLVTIYKAAESYKKNHRRCPRISTRGIELYFLSIH